MNEDHIIAAILAAGLLAQNKDEDIQPKDAVSLYGLCLRGIIDSNRTERELSGS